MGNLKYFTSLVAISSLLLTQVARLKASIMMQRLTYILLLQLVATVSLFSDDLTIKYKVTISTMLGMASDTATVVEYHSSSHKLVSNQKSQTDTIFDYNDFVRYKIDHKKKIISKFALDDVVRCQEAINQIAKKNPSGKVSVDAKQFGDISNVAVKQDGVELLLNRKCNKLIISMGKFKGKSSVDFSLVSPTPQNDKSAMLHDIPYSIMPNYADTFGKFYSLLSQKGIPLKLHTEMPVGWLTIKTSHEAVEIVKGTIPATAFVLPKGYTWKDEGKEQLEKIKTVETKTSPQQELP
jgi:hypothetical protein